MLLSVYVYTLDTWSCHDEHFDTHGLAVIDYRFAVLNTRWLFCWHKKIILKFLLFILVYIKILLTHHYNNHPHHNRSRILDVTGIFVCFGKFQVASVSVGLPSPSPSFELPQPLVWEGGWERKLPRLLWSTSWSRLRPGTVWAEERRYCGCRVPTTDRSPPVEVSPRISNLISNYQVTACRGLTGQSF